MASSRCAFMFLGAEGEGVLKMADIPVIAIAGQGDDVEAEGLILQSIDVEKMLRRPRHTIHSVGSDSLFGTHIGMQHARLDLDEGHLAIVVGNDVDFAMRVAQIARQDVVAVQQQVEGGPRLAFFA